MSLSTEYPVEVLETTGCIRRIEKVMRSHTLSIVGYSLDKDIGKGEFIESTIVQVGGHDWSIMYYPNGSTEAKDDDLSLFLTLKSKSLTLKSNSEVVKAQFRFTILDQSGRAIAFSITSQITNFTADKNWGYSSFAKRSELESKIKDDCFIIKCAVTVFKAFPIETTAQIVVPPGNIQQQLRHLLDNGNGADVTFEVDGQILSAHKCILATRSPVFLAQIFGPMKEKSDTTIKIEEIEAPVFKAMLHFIYNDSFPGLEETKGSDEKPETKSMAQQLLVAADRYGLERLKVICEKMMCGSINTMSCSSVNAGEVVTLLSLAERHSCNHLKAVCLKFLGSPGILQGVAATELFQYLIKNDPLISKEMLYVVSFLALSSFIFIFVKCI